MDYGPHVEALPSSGSRSGVLGAGKLGLRSRTARWTPVGRTGRANSARSRQRRTGADRGLAVDLESSGCPQCGWYGQHVRAGLDLALDLLPWPEENHSQHHGHMAAGTEQRVGAGELFLSFGPRHRFRYRCGDRFLAPHCGLGLGEVASAPTVAEQPGVTDHREVLSGNVPDQPADEGVHGDGREARSASGSVVSERERLCPGPAPCDLTSQEHEIRSWTETSTPPPSCPDRTIAVGRPGQEGGGKARGNGASRGSGTPAGRAGRGADKPQPRPGCGPQRSRI